MNAQLQKKIDFAIKLMQSIPTDSGPIELCYSGGKDSDVILELAKMSGIEYRAIYKNSTIDQPGTIKHCREKGVEILAPTVRFFDLVKTAGTPNRHRRFCCAHLKEYKVLDRAIQGIRREESRARANRYKEPEQCRTYRKGGKCRVYLPILDWTDEDEVEFIAERGIRCHPHYYDELGEFHVERRVGCLCCPLMSINKRRAEFLKYPKILKLYIKNLQIFIDNNPQSKSAIFTRGSAYNGMFHELFITKPGQYERVIDGGLFPESGLNTKSFLEDYFRIDLTI